MITGLDHVDIIVKDWEAAIEQYKKIFGTDRVEYMEDIPERGYRLARIPFGNGQSINILTPTDETGPWARHLAAHGDGIYLFALTADDLDRTAEEMRERGVRMPAPMGGLRVIHPSSAGGALILLRGENTRPPITRESGAQ